MKAGDTHGIRQFLKDYPGMCICPSRGSDMTLKGVFSFSAKLNSNDAISDDYQLTIEIPFSFPKDIPEVTETEQKIPRDGMHHVNPDNTLCLGSPIRLLKKISEKPTLIGFAESCLVPYLYAVSHKIQYGGDFAFSELAHGDQGIICDYIELFGLNNKEQVIRTLELLGTRQRIANKSLCPCGCGLRLSKCPFRFKINDYRNIASRSWFRTHARSIGTRQPHYERRNPDGGCPPKC